MLPQLATLSLSSAWASVRLRERLLSELSRIHSYRSAEQIRAAIGGDADVQCALDALVRDGIAMRSASQYAVASTHYSKIRRK